jgi:hypothetical protein
MGEGETDRGQDVQDGLNGGEPQFFDKHVPGAEKVGAEFDFEKFRSDIDRILSEEFKDGVELLNKLGTCLYDAVRLSPQIVQKIRLEFVKYLTGGLTKLERRKPKVVEQMFYSRRDFAHRAVGVAFDMLAGGRDAPSALDSTRAELGDRAKKVRRWTGEGRSRETGGNGSF